MTRKNAILYFIIYHEAFLSAANFSAPRLIGNEVLVKYFLNFHHEAVFWGYVSRDSIKKYEIYPATSTSLGCFIKHANLPTQKVSDWPAKIFWYFMTH
jgi:hypothetical protein